MIAALLLLVIGAVGVVSMVAGRIQTAGFEPDLMASQSNAATAPKFWDELGFFATDDPAEEGLAYRLDSSDPVLIAAQERYRSLYGPIFAANRAKAKSHLALVGAQTASTDISTLPIVLEPGFVDMTPQNVVLARMLPRIPNRAKFVDWNTVSLSDPAEFIASINEGDLPVSQDDTFHAQRLEMSVLAARFEVTGLAQAASQGFVDLNDWRLRRRLQAILESTEDQILNGTAADANGFVGLQQMVTTNTTNLAAATIATDDLDDLMEQIHVQHGMPSFGIASHGVVNDLRKELKANQQIVVGNSPPQAFGGFAFPAGMNRLNYNGIDIIGSDFLNNGAGVKELYLLQTDDLRLRELRPLMVERLAKTRDSNDWGITNYLTFQDMSANDPAGPPGTGIGGQHHGRIFNIA